MTPKPGLTLGMTKAGAASASPLAGLTEPQQAPLATLNAGAAATLNAGAAQAGIGAVRVYQWTVRPLIGAHCRFWPSCSEYAVEALRTHGAAKGTVLAAKRILRCNPWNEGGVDPVPRRDGDRVDRNMGH